MLPLILALTLGQMGPEPTAVPSDAPFVKEFEPVPLDGTFVFYDSREVYAGDVVFAKGCWVEEAGCIANAQGMRACEAERSALRQAMKDPPARWPWFLGGLALGAGAVLAFALAAN